MYTRGRLSFMEGDAAEAIANFKLACRAYSTAHDATSLETLTFVVPAFGELALRLVQRGEDAESKDTVTALYDLLGRLARNGRAGSPQSYRSHVDFMKRYETAIDQARRDLLGEKRDDSSARV